MRSPPPLRSAKRQSVQNLAIDLTGGESFDIFSLPPCVIGIISIQILSEDAADLFDIMHSSKRAKVKIMEGIRTVKRRIVDGWVCSFKGLVMVTREGVAETMRNLDIVGMGAGCMEGVKTKGVGKLSLDKLTIISMRQDENRRKGNFFERGPYALVQWLLIIMSRSVGALLNVEVLESVAVTMQLEVAAAKVQWHNTFVRMGETGIAWEVATDIVKLWSRWSARDNPRVVAPRVVNVVSTQLKARAQRHLPPTNPWVGSECSGRSCLGVLVDANGVDTTKHTQATILDTAALTDDGVIEQVVMGQPAGLSESNDNIMMRLVGSSHVTTQIRSVLRRGIVWQKGKVFKYELGEAIPTCYTPKAINDHSGNVWCEFSAPLYTGGAQGGVGGASDTLEKMPLIYEEVSCFMWPTNSISHNTLYDAFLF